MLPCRKYFLPCHQFYAFTHINIFVNLVELCTPYIQCDSAHAQQDSTVLFFTSEVISCYERKNLVNIFFLFCLGMFRFLMASFFKGLINIHQNYGPLYFLKCFYDYTLPTSLTIMVKPGEMLMLNHQYGAVLVGPTCMQLIFMLFKIKRIKNKKLCRTFTAKTSVDCLFDYKLRANHHQVLFAHAE